MKLTSYHIDTRRYTKLQQIQKYDPFSLTDRRDYSLQISSFAKETRQLVLQTVSHGFKLTREEHCRSFAEQGQKEDHTAIPIAAGVTFPPLHSFIGNRRRPVEDPIALSFFP